MRVNGGKKKYCYLELNATISAIPGRLVEEILQRLQHLLQEVSLDEPGLKHDASQLKCFCKKTKTSKQ